MESIFLEDKRVKCVSGLGRLDVREYLALVEEVYAENGGYPWTKSSSKNENRY